MQMLTGWGADLEFCLQENKTITTQLNEVRLQLEKMAYENKEFQINHDALRDQNADQAAELEDLRVCKLFYLGSETVLKTLRFQKTIQELKISNKGLSQEGREKKKAEKVAEMMKSFDTVRSRSIHSRAGNRSDPSSAFLRAECPKKKSTSVHP